MYRLIDKARLRKNRMEFQRLEPIIQFSFLKEDFKIKRLMPILINVNKPTITVKIIDVAEM
jgi:hypothetical protein